MKKIGIITSGGDCGGLNAVIKGAAQMAHNYGISTFVIPNGYAGLYNLVDFDALVELTPERLDSLDTNIAGSEAGHSRVKIRKIEDDKKLTAFLDNLLKLSENYSEVKLAVYRTIRDNKPKSLLVKLSKKPYMTDFLRDHRKTT